MTLLLRRLALLPFLALAAASLVFLLVNAIPGDPAVVRLGESAAPADLAVLRHSLGLDLPLASRYAKFVGGLVTGDFGFSWHSQRPNLDLILERFPATVELAACALVMALALSFPVALGAAARRGSLTDRLVRSGASGVAALPTYALGPVLVLLFAVNFGWFPVSGRRDPFSWLLPALTLAIPLSATLVRLIRANLEDELLAPYLAAARARGLSPARLLAKHALSNAALPVVTMIGLQLGSLLTGALVTETLFAWPGIGRLLIESIRRRDDPLLVATVFFFALVYLVVNLGVDLLYGMLDPRVRMEDSR